MGEIVERHELQTFSEPESSKILFALKMKKNSRAFWIAFKRASIKRNRNQSSFFGGS